MEHHLALVLASGYTAAGRVDYVRGVNWIEQAGGGLVGGMFQNPNDLASTWWQVCCRGPRY